MNRAELQQLSAMREAEAQVLLRSGHHPGAYYLMGYAVECALKACIAKQVREHDFPNKRLVEQAYTHNLDRLLTAAHLADQFESERLRNRVLRENWRIVQDWSESARYIVDKTRGEAENLVEACSGTDGILNWIRARW